LASQLCARDRQLPFDDDHLPTLFKKIKKGVFLIPQHVSTAASDLLKRMLTVDPVERITVAQIRYVPVGPVGGKQRAGVWRGH
jgi:serine/threonine protein kinase